MNIVKVKEPLIPDTYTQVEYINNGAGGYVILDFTPTTKTDIELLAQKTGAKSLFGADTNSYTITGSGTSTTCYCCGSSTAFANEDFSKKIYSFKGNFVTSGGEIKSISRTDTAPQYPLALFARTTSESSASDAATNSKIWYCKIWDNDILIRDLVAVKRNSDSVYGFYDLVSGNFYSSSGSIAFTGGEPAADPLMKDVYYGDIKIPRKYVEASSDDYPEKAKGWAILELDGSENWSPHSSQPLFTTSAPSNAELKSDTLPCVCNGLKGLRPSTGASSVKNKEIKVGYYSTTSSRTLYLRNDDCSTVEELKEYLSNNNLTVLYPLTISDDSVWTFVKNTEDNSFGYYNEETDKYVKAYDTTGTVIGDLYAHHMLNCSNS